MSDEAIRIFGRTKARWWGAGAGVGVIAGVMLGLLLALLPPDSGPTPAEQLEQVRQAQVFIQDCQEAGGHAVMAIDNKTPLCRPVAP